MNKKEQIEKQIKELQDELEKINESEKIKVGDLVLVSLKCDRNKFWIVRVVEVLKCGIESISYTPANGGVESGRIDQNHFFTYQNCNFEKINL